MGLEKIKEEILLKATAAEKEILAEAATKIDEIKKKTNEKLKGLEKEAEQKLQAETKTMENKENSLVNMESKKMLFDMKKEIMDNVYKQAFEKIKAMPKNQRESMVKNLLQTAQKEMDVKVVYANKTDAPFIDDSFEVKQVDADGCIICESEDGKVRIDYTFATLFEDIKDKTAKEVSKILFG